MDRGEHLRQAEGRLRAGRQPPRGQVALHQELEIVVLPARERPAPEDAAVGEYVTVVASYLYGQDLIDGICYVTSFKVDGWIHTRGARAGQLNNDVKNGYLAYCVVANDAKAEQMLAYHYQDIVNAADTVPRVKAGKAWRLITFDEFRRKCPRTQLPTRAPDWPIVYYAANA